MFFFFKSARRCDTARPLAGQAAGGRVGVRVGSWPAHPVKAQHAVGGVVAHAAAGAAAAGELACATAGRAAFGGVNVSFPVSAFQPAAGTVPKQLRCAFERASVIAGPFPPKRIVDCRATGSVGEEVLSNQRALFFLQLSCDWAQ